MNRWQIAFGKLALTLEMPADAQLCFDFLNAYFCGYCEFNLCPTEISALVHIQVYLGTSTEVLDFGQVQPVLIDGSKDFLRCTARQIRANSHQVWSWLEPFSVTACVDTATRVIRVWGPTPKALRVPLLRIIEDLFLNEIQRNRGIIVHASGVVADGRSTLVLGNKGAGKSSLLVKLLQNFDVQKLANDNVCLQLEKDEMTVQGWPAFMKLCAGTVATHRELVHDFPEQARTVLDNDAELWAVYEKIPLYPSQAAERFATRLAASAPLGAVILPRFTTSLPGRLSIANYTDLASELRLCLQGMFNPNHSEWLHLNPADRDQVLASCDEIARWISRARIPVYYLDWGVSLGDLLLKINELRPASKLLRACRLSTRKQESWPDLPKIADVQ